MNVDGRSKHAVLGVSRSPNALYLIAFEGTVSLPDSVIINYKRGVDDLQKELIDTYAPSLPYGKLLETARLIKSLERYRDVPSAEILALTHRFADSTTRNFFFAPGRSGRAAEFGANRAEDQGGKFSLEWSL